ncbi:uncharacterized protein LOC143249962 isoform X1 [Tachypleus tridentatus]|uniref:uncharacterized protein LOC143249962 isoform X1 n=1 Tax=Tachypleus tridentatus TaxID=6853 RepID=UPI003FD24F7E
MLKHVHFSSSSLVPYRCKTPTRDNVSLSSVLRFGSSLGPELTSSWSSSTSSLQEMSFPPEPPKIPLLISWLYCLVSADTSSTYPRFQQERDYFYCRSRFQEKKYQK